MNSTSTSTSYRREGRELSVVELSVFARTLEPNTKSSRDNVNDTCKRHVSAEACESKDDIIFLELYLQRELKEKYRRTTSK